jgi:AraC-like DNA-binding protein
MLAIQVKNLDSSDGMLIIGGDNMIGWEKIEAVQRMQDYIEEHVADKISLRDLANAANYSPWHSARIFKEMTGKAPFEYIRALRLSRAAVRLLEPDSRVVDVAFDFVFDSHEGFTRAFSKQFGMSPRDYAKEPSTSRLFMPSRIRDYYLTMQKGEIPVKKNENANTVFVQVIEKPARKLILKRGVNASHYF